MCPSCQNVSDPRPFLQPNRGGRISRRAMLFGAAGLGAAAVIGGGAYAVPRAMAQDLHIIPAAEWGAVAPAYAAPIQQGSPRTIVVHHTAGANTQDFSLEAAHRVARVIQNFHMGQGWGDSGQHFTISRGGHVLEARQGSLAAAQDGSYFVEGIHARNVNFETIGIENEGTYMTEMPTDAQWGSLVALIAYLCRQYGLDASSIQGHRESSATACPGDMFFAALDQLRADVTAALNGGGDATAPAEPSPEPNPEAPDDEVHPDDAQDGPPLAGWPTVRQGDSGAQVLALQRLLRHRWNAVPSDGTYGATTVQGVQRFQQQMGLGTDGVAGPLTWHNVVVDVPPGAEGEAARAAQELLKQQGAEIEVDGRFDPASQAALKRFQSQRDVPATGVVDAYTWQELIG